MAPMWLGSLSPPSEMKLFSRHVAVTSVDPDPVWSSVAAQWQNPADILAILMLLGPTVVQRAIAQLAGRTITPVAFSFGWVAYAASALLASFGGMNPLTSGDVMTWHSC